MQNIVNTSVLQFIFKHICINSCEKFTLKKCKLCYDILYPKNALYKQH